MKNILLYIIILSIIVIPYVLAETPEESSYIFKQSTDIDLKISCFDLNNTYCNAGTNCNLTILNPNSNSLINNQQMTYNTAFYNYTLNTTQTSYLGEYPVIILCSGISSGFSSFNFQVTYTGKPEPSDFTKVAFIIGFIAILCLMVVTIINVAGHIILLDTDFMDVAYSFCIYFILFAIKNFNLSYGNNALIDNFSDIFIKVGIFTHILIPLVALILSMTLGKLKRTKLEQGEE